MSTILAAPAAAPSVVGDAEGRVERLLETLRSMTEEQRAEIVGLLGVAAPAKRAVGAKTVRASAVPAARKAAAAAPLPEPEEDGAPSAESYRIKEEDIDHAVCVGRILKGGKDKRWSPAVYREFQCGKATEDECDLCKTCQARLEKYAEDAKPGGDWTGRVTEEPPGWVHMLDTAWAEARKPKWQGEGAAAAASDSGSEASAAPSASAASAAASSAGSSKKEAAAAAKAAKAAEKEAAKAAKEEEKAAKAAEKEAAKAAKAAEKEAAKAAKAAEKEAAKAAKEAEKAAKAASKPAKKAAAPAVKKAAGGAGAPAPAAAPAKAAAAAAAAEVEMELKLIDGEIFAVKGKNVYKYDEDAEEAGAYQGRLTEDETIDREAAEEDEE
jgi:hypothetical protein